MIKTILCIFICFLTVLIFKYSYPKLFNIDFEHKNNKHKKHN
jgi:hypothetical protein